MISLLVLKESWHKTDQTAVDRGTEHDAASAFVLSLRQRNASGRAEKNYSSPHHLFDGEYTITRQHTYKCEQ